MSSERCVICGSNDRKVISKVPAHFPGPFKPENRYNKKKMCCSRCYAKQQRLVRLNNVIIYLFILLFS